mgnify:CR=1 FL=1
MAWLLHFYYVHKAVAAVEIRTKFQGSADEGQRAFPLPSLRIAQTAAKFAAQTVAGGHDGGLADVASGLDGGSDLRCAVVGIKTAGKTVGHIVVDGQAGALRKSGVSLLRATVVVVIGHARGAFKGFDAVTAQGGEGRGGNEVVASEIYNPARAVDSGAEFVKDLAARTGLGCDGCLQRRVENAHHRGGDSALVGHFEHHAVRGLDMERHIDTQRARTLRRGYLIVKLLVTVAIERRSGGNRLRCRGEKAVALG